jgi:hypothetical protein
VARECSFEPDVPGLCIDAPETVSDFLDMEYSALLIGLSDAELLFPPVGL